jgi:hypothetical protein
VLDKKVRREKTTYNYAEDFPGWTPGMAPTRDARGLLASYQRPIRPKWNVLEFTDDGSDASGNCVFVSSEVRTLGPRLWRTRLGSMRCGHGVRRAAGGGRNARQHDWHVCLLGITEYLLYIIKGRRETTGLMRPVVN